MFDFSHLQEKTWRFLANNRRISDHMEYADQLEQAANVLLELRSRVAGRAMDLINEADNVRA